MIFLTSQIIDMLNQDGCPVGDKEIAFRLNENINAVKATLLILQKESRIVQTSSGRWEAVMALPKSLPGDKSKGSRRSRPWGKSLTPDSNYICNDPEYIGKIPVRTDIPVEPDLDESDD